MRIASCWATLMTLSILALLPMPAWSDDRPALASRLDELQRALETAYKAKDYAKALDAAEKLHAYLEPTFFTSRYNIACLYSRLDQPEQAYSWLEKAIDAGFYDYEQMKQDPDLANLRSQDRFRALVKRAWVTGYIAMLERSEREEFQKPTEVMAALAFRPGERVADIGAGSGYFTIPVAKAVGQSGTVFALDIEQLLLDHLAKRVRSENLANVQPRLVAKDDPQLAPGSVDTILMIDTLHYVQDRTAYAKKLRSALAPGGRVVVIDYIPKPESERPWGPPPEQQFAREIIDADLAAAGLTPAKVHEFLPEQYFVEYQAE